MLFIKALLRYCLIDVNQLCKRSLVPTNLLLFLGALLYFVKYFGLSNRLVWNSTSLPRHSFILWLIMIGRLKTRQFLNTQGLNISDNCGICNCLAESIEHLFFTCPTAKQMRKDVLTSYGIGITRTPGSWAVERTWLLKNCKGRSRKTKFQRLQPYIYGVARKEYKNISRQEFNLTTSRLTANVLHFLHLKCVG